VARRQAKRRDPRRAATPPRGPGPRNAAPPSPAQPAPPPKAARLGRPLRPTESIAVSVIAVTGLVAFAGFFDAFDFYDANPLIAIALTFILLGAVFSIERRAIAATTRASVRFAGAGVVVPVLWWLVPYAAMTPIGAMQGYSTYRLGVGSVFGPAFVGAILTGTIFNPTAGLMSCTASVFGGTAALLFTRTGA
jgi:hypothetical protein